MSKPPAKPYNKKALSLTEQIQHLKSKKLIILDEADVEQKLKFISFHRINGYTLGFREDKTDYSSNFICGTTFDDIFDCYVFDRELKLLITDALERIEIAIRTVMANILSDRHTPHWYTNFTLFSPSAKYETDIFPTIKREIKRSQRNVFIKHYYDNYNSPEHPPSWVIAEVISFGKWSIMFANLHDADKKAISAEFGFHYEEMKSWLETLSWVRNSCAHHARMWNTSILKSPRLKGLKKHGYPGTVPNGNCLYASLIIIQIFIKVIAPHSTWKEKLKDLVLKKHSNIPVSTLGFPKEWETMDFWK
jgi:abortive infection bacteriophage resistance protein